MKAVGYARVSTDKQENSADAQKKRILGAAVSKEYELVEVIEDFDQFSGNLDRLGVQRVLAMVTAKQIDAVIVTKLDRLTRSTRDAIDLIELFGKFGVALISLSESLDTESPIGRFVVRLMASIAELERETIGKRTSEGLQNIKSQGFPAGTAPFGYRSQPRTERERELKIRKPLIENPKEKLILARIEELRDGERMKWEDIADTLNREGHRTRTGGKWQFKTVHRIYKTVIVKGRKKAA
jgi:site-specific DNA recombinase